MLASAACNKSDDDNTNNNNNNSSVCATGSNFCMKVDGNTISKNATWKVLSNRNRILWEEGSGNSYVNVELDIYGTTTGAYTISASPGAASSAGFQYFMGSAAGNKNITGQSGTVNVTSIDGTTITGNFTVVGKDAAGNNYQITDGHFVSVAQ